MMSSGSATVGRRLGVDVGAVRIGVALSDEHAILASPLVTLERGSNDIAALAALVAEHDVVEVIIGLPRTLTGRSGVSARDAREFAGHLAEALGPVPVRLADERLTTVRARRMLSDRGVRGRRQRAVIDQAAAVEILQTWLEAGPSRRGHGRSAEGGR